MYDEITLSVILRKLIGVASFKRLYMDDTSSGLSASLTNFCDEQDIKYCSHKDVNARTEPQVVIHYDLSKNYKKLILNKWPNSKHILCLQECEVIKPSNWDIKSHEIFDKVITWHSDFITSEKYAHVFTIQGFNGDKDLPIKAGWLHKEKLVTIICANNISNHPKELYSEKLKCIKWFEKHHQDEFDLFGYGGNLLPSGGNLIVKIIKNIPFLSKKLSKKYTVYKGSVTSKRPVLEKYKFNICFENAKNIPGYITEKIFDSFISGTIPVYLGAPNVSEFIPENCFIDMAKFDSYESLYNFMISMSKEDYIDYQVRIQGFLESANGKKFSNSNYAITIQDNISKLLNS